MFASCYLCSSVFFFFYLSRYICLTNYFQISFSLFFSLAPVLKWKQINFFSFFLFKSPHFFLAAVGLVWPSAVLNINEPNIRNCIIENDNANPSFPPFVASRDWARRPIRQKEKKIEREKKKLFGPLITAVGSQKDRSQLRRRIL